jgi:hypothetical protein
MYLVRTDSDISRSILDKKVALNEPGEAFSVGWTSRGRTHCLDTWRLASKKCGKSASDISTFLQFIACDHRDQTFLYRVRYPPLTMQPALKTTRHLCFLDRNDVRGEHGEKTPRDG